MHVLVGMGILSKFGIEITGLVSQHGFQNSPRIPSPIDDSIEPNAHPLMFAIARNAKFVVK